MIKKNNEFMKKMSDYRFDSKLSFISDSIEKAIIDLYELLEQQEEGTEEYYNLQGTIIKLKEVDDELGGHYRQ